jgi:hypothetical protein
MSSTDDDTRVNSQIKMLQSMMRHLRECQAQTGMPASEEYKKKMLQILDEHWDDDDFTFSSACVIHIHKKDDDASSNNSQ